MLWSQFLAIWANFLGPMLWIKNIYFSQKSAFFTKTRRKTSPPGPHGWNLSSRGYVHPSVHPQGWTLSTI
jgi:hypothetical protein